MTEEDKNISKKINWEIIYIWAICPIFICLVVFLIFIGEGFEKISEMAIGESSVKNMLITEEGPIRDWLEVFSFSASVGLLMFAAIAIPFSERQFRLAREQNQRLIEQNNHAEKARLASIYIVIQGRWNDKEVVGSRRLLNNLKADFKKHCGDIQIHGGRKIHFACVEDYVNCRLQILNKKDLVAYRRHIVMLSFMEDVGVLCRKEYVKTQDISDLIGSGVISGAEEMLPHIMWKRFSAQSNTLWANALHLYEEMKSRESYPKPGYGAKL